MQHELFIFCNGICSHNPCFNGGMDTFSHIQCGYSCSISNDKQIVPVAAMISMKKIIIVPFGVMGQLFYQGKFYKLFSKKTPVIHDGPVLLL